MAAKLNPQEIAAAAELRRFLDDAIGYMVAEALRIPRSHENLATFVEVGSTVQSLEALKNLLPR